MREGLSLQLDPGRSRSRRERGHDPRRARSYRATPTATADFGSPFAFAGGGGIDNWGTLTLTNTTVSDNEVGGPVASLATGAGIRNQMSLTLNNSIVRGNHAVVSAPNGCSASGGGIVSGGTLRIANSAVNENSVQLSRSSSCDGEAQAGAIFVQGGGTATINDINVSGNRVAASTSIGDAFSFSGGIANYGVLDLHNSRVTDNQVTAATSGSGTANPTAGGLGIVVTTQHDQNSPTRRTSSVCEPTSGQAIFEQLPSGGSPRLFPPRDC